MVDRYGEAIEFDLHRYLGLDLLDFFRGRHSWRKLLALLPQLPHGSAYWAARADDDEAAEAYLAAHPDDPERGPGGLPLTELSLSVQLQAQAVDMLRVVAARIEALGGGKPPAVVPIPRATTALQRAKDRSVDAYVTELVAEVERAQAREG